MRQILTFFSISINLVIVFPVKVDPPVSEKTSIFIDVASQYGVTYEGITEAILEAQTYFSLYPDLEVILHIKEGLHILTFPHHQSSIDFTGPQPGPRGRLILEGEGSQNTLLIVDPSHTILQGRNIFHLTVRNIQFRRSQPLVSQGIVVEAGRGFVEVTLEEGFPLISSIFDNTSTHGRYLKKYTRDDGDCKIVEHDNDQVAWSNYTLQSQGSLRFQLTKSNFLPPYQQGDLVGVKSKCCGDGHNAYWFCGGDDLSFENIVWYRQSRGVIRCGISNVKFLNITIPRTNQSWCMSTSGGGPQIGQPGDGDIHNVTVDSLVAENTGDDSIAFFNVKSGGEVKNCRIRDSFARGILLYKSPKVVLENNVVERCPVLHVEQFWEGWMVHAFGWVLNMFYL